MGEELRDWIKDHKDWSWLKKHAFGTHLPLLLQCLLRTRNPVLELGCGEYSTPFLHLFANAGRMVMSLEQQEDIARTLNARYQSATHSVAWVHSYDHPLIDQFFWGVVLVDGPAERRRIDTARVAMRAEYVVVHDYGEDLGYNFGWRRDFSEYQTSVASNFHDLRDLEEP